MKLKPSGENIVVKIVKKEKTASGLILPEDSSSQTDEGEILAVGPGKLVKLFEGGEQQITVMSTDGTNVGDRILFTKFPYNEVEFEGEKLYIIKIDDILAKITE